MNLSVPRAARWNHHRGRPTPTSYVQKTYVQKTCVQKTYLQTALTRPNQFVLQLDTRFQPQTDRQKAHAEPYVSRAQARAANQASSLSSSSWAAARFKAGDS